MSKDLPANSGMFHLSKITSLIKTPGDSIVARMTQTGRQVLKINTSNVKYSRTVYPNGTSVETRTTRTK